MCKQRVESKHAPLGIARACFPCMRPASVPDKGIWARDEGGRDGKIAHPAQAAELGLHSHALPGERLSCCGLGT
jgi:hypothetical protein